MGKFSFRKLSEIIGCIKTSERIIIPPTPGFDAGVYEIDRERYMVVATDPCTGVPERWFGWFLIHYSASDVALFGAKPEFASVNLLGPPGTSYKVYRRIMNQACKAAEDLGLYILTGHTGNYSSLTQIIGTCTISGYVKKDKLITPGNSRSNDLIVMVKPLGLETLTNFSLTHKEESKILFGSGEAKILRSMVSSQSCVEEALLLSGIEGVHALHDTTEGGIVSALNEMADTSGLEFEVSFDSLPITNELKRLQKHFNLTVVELLSTSSTGSLLASIDVSNKSGIGRALNRHGVPYWIIGKFTEKNSGRILKIRGKKRIFPLKARDPYEKIFFLR